METPPLSNKSTVSSASKSSLTPCRRMGLSRRSSLIKQIHQNIKAETPPTQGKCLSDQKDNLAITPEVSTSTNTPSIVDPTLSGKQKKVTSLKARRCLNTPVKQTSNFPVKLQESCLDLKSQDKLEHDDEEDIHIIKKRRLSSNEAANKSQVPDIIDSGKSKNETQNVTEPVTDEMIMEVLMSIKKKRQMLDTLKVQETYAKKHNVAELREQTARWKAAGQEALRYTVQLARDAGYSVSINQLMSQHGFPPHLVTYDSDEDEFQ